MASRERNTGQQAYAAERDRILRRFGVNVRAERTGWGLSQESLARVARLHRTEISLVERARRGPNLLTLLILAHALRVEPAALLRGLPVPLERRPSPYAARRRTAPDRGPLRLGGTILYVPDGEHADTSAGVVSRGGGGEA
jgi:transcriptional regulator with XRE-family HTH domain